ncbi:hypothetical protein BT93_K1343 [Corymbia citriodora subsp. variegata]|nr:hypothetical protein BT93_K1343 [Corymbia citriodora subsp. variegata]
MNMEPGRSDMLDIFFDLFCWICRLCSTNALEMEREEPIHLEDPTYRASSSLTSPHIGDHEGRTKKPEGNNYEVFLSFRGKDTRESFTDYLYTSLVNAGIHVFRDDNELRIGEEIGPELLCGITHSKISIPIISENYSSSKWCLRELVQMLKCKKSRGQIVLPIFYKVEPSQLRHLTRRWKDAINAHKKNMGENVVKEWEEALKEVSFLKGWESKKICDGREGELVKMIVKKVTSELKRTFQQTLPKELVGVDDRVKEIMSLIGADFKNTTIVGIYGMGGIGKTTLAKVLYNKLSSHFECLSFLTNIRETCARKGIECLQKKLIDDILRGVFDVSNVEEGIGVIRSRFTRKKVLIVLDDVDDNFHLEALVGDGSCFEAGSIVIITTRNKSILGKASASHLYQLKELSLDQSLLLFSRHAFRKDSPQSDYEVISHDVVSTTGGLPLALEVIGSFLCGNRKEVWNDTLKKLKKMPDKTVQEKLKISYDALDYEEKQIFLDIACFFIGSQKQSPTYMWDACDFYPERGIDVLSHLSLIKIDKNGELLMHDQLRDLGREIVRQENLKEPLERSRLWNKEEAVDVFDSNKGTRKIEALCLDNNDRRRRYTNEQFKELTELRFLQFDGANFVGDFQNLLPQLRWLQWWYCPSDFIATNFHPKKLVVLDLSNSAITEDWGGWGLLKIATKLKVLNLTCCRSLRRIPELSTLKSLEILILKSCWDLEEIHPSIGDINTLVSLNARGCCKLGELPVGVGRMEELRELLLASTNIQEIPISRGCLMKLETLSANNCKELAQLPKSMGSLVLLIELDLSYSAIEKLPEFMGSLVSLTQLNLSHLAIKKLPESMDSLVSLTQLNLSYSAIEKLPESMGSLVSLTRLNLSYSAIEKLPESMGSLVSLTQLNLSHSAIEKLPESMGSVKELKFLNASYCKSLAHIPNSIGHLPSLSVLDLNGCDNLAQLPISIGSLTSLTTLHLARTAIVELPEGIVNLQNLRILDINGTGITELPRNIGELISLNRLQLDGSDILSLPGSISKLSSLQLLSFQNCKKLQEVRELPSGLTTLGITCQSPPSPHLSQLTLLNDLTLSDCNWLECLPELPVGLSSLWIKDCGKLKALTNLSSLERLFQLILDNCLELTEVTGLEGLQSLSELQVCRCPKIYRLGEVESLESLRGLHIDEAFPDSSKLTSAEVSQLGGSPDLSKSKILQEINSGSGANLIETEGLDGSESSQTLDISECTSAGRSQGLSSLRNLRFLFVTECTNLTEIRGLDGLESLTHLSISECTSLRQSLDLSNLKKLQMFKAENCENLVEIQGLDGLKSLSDLNISGCTFLGQSLDLSNFKTLYRFYAINCNNLVEIRGLDSLTSLGVLDISGCTSLRQSLDLSNLKGLWAFRAANCENLVEIQAIDRLKFLRELDISGCTSLRQSIDLSTLSCYVRMFTRSHSGDNLILRRSMSPTKQNLSLDDGRNEAGGPGNHPTSSLALRDEASLPGGGGDVLVPVVGADSGGIRLRQEVGPSEVSLMMTITFRPREQWSLLAKM